MNDKKSYVSENLNTLRKKNKMTINELSNAVDLSNSTIKNIEEGVSLQNIDTIVKISKFFNVKVHDFVYKKL